MLNMRVMNVVPLLVGLDIHWPTSVAPLLILSKLHPAFFNRIDKIL